MNKLTLEYPTAIEISVPELAVNLVLCILASVILRYVFMTRSVSLSSKFHVGTTIPILSCVTFLVIMVVKSSLALSLGLVGALSIVRFRTPVKEPEELVYLFLAIGIGLGYGAGQTFVTTIVFIVIMLMIIFGLSRSASASQVEYNLLVEWSDPKLEMSAFLGPMRNAVEMLNLQKYNAGPQGRSIFAQVTVKDAPQVQKLIENLRAISPDVNCSFYEARPLQ